MPLRLRLRSQLILLSLGALSISAGLAYQAHAEPRTYAASEEISLSHYARGLLETADEFEQTLAAHDEGVIANTLTPNEATTARQNLNAQFHELFSGLNLLELNGKAIEADIIRTQLENAFERHMESEAAYKTPVTNDIDRYSLAFTESHIAYASRY